jgi:hypothetical protein
LKVVSLNDFGFRTDEVSSAGVRADERTGSARHAALTLAATCKSMHEDERVLMTNIMRTGKCGQRR